MRLEALHSTAAFIQALHVTVDTRIGVNGSKCQTLLEQMHQAPVKVAKLLYTLEKSLVIPGR